MKGGGEGGRERGEEESVYVAQEDRKRRGRKGECCPE